MQRYLSLYQEYPLELEKRVKKMLVKRGNHLLWPGAVNSRTRRPVLYEKGKTFWVERLTLKYRYRAVNYRENCRRIRFMRTCQYYNCVNPTHFKIVHRLFKSKPKKKVEKYKPNVFRIREKSTVEMKLGLRNLGINHLSGF